MVDEGANGYLPGAQLLDHRAADVASAAASASHQDAM
jgi:hypothetical protein